MPLFEPAGAGAGFATRLGQIPREERVHEFARTHIVQEGETLSEIAEKYGTTVDVLKKVNRIKRPNMVAVGRKLIIPPESSRSIYGTND